MLQQKQDEILSLIKEKDDIEAEIVKLTKTIEELNKKELDKNLVDKEGFPREDLNFGELAEFKALKKKFREKQNDLTTIMKVLENGLFSIHEYYRESGQAQKDIENYEKNLPEKKPIQPIIAKKQEPQKLEKEPKIEFIEKESFSLPFSEISEVIEDSPSFNAGVKLHDLIYKFGDCSYYNHNNLQYLSEIVKENVNKEIQIELYREEKNLDEKDEKKDLINHKDIYYKVFKIVIIPKIWKGQGVLGCRFKNIT